MCLAVPAEVVELPEDGWAIIDVAGVRNRVSLALIDEVAVGDYVIVHVGFAIARLDEEEAQKSLELFRQIADHLSAAPG